MGGNIEVIVLAGVTGTFALNIADVQPSARGGAAIFYNGQVETVALTDRIRGGERSFEFTLGNQGTVSDNSGGPPPVVVTVMPTTPSGVTEPIPTPSGTVVTTLNPEASSATPTIVAQPPGTSAGTAVAAVTSTTTTSPTATQPAATSGGITAVTAQVNATSSLQTSSGATGGIVQALPRLTAVLVATVSLQANGVTGLGSTAESGGTAGSTNGLATANGPAIANPVGPGGELTPQAILDRFFEGLTVTEAVTLGASGSGLAGVIQSLLDALRQGGQEGIRRTGTPLRPGAIFTAPMPADAEAPGLDPAPQEDVAIPAEEGQVSVIEAVADPRFAGSPQASLSALLGLATLTAGLTWSPWAEESEDAKPKRGMVRRTPRNLV